MYRPVKLFTFALLAIALLSFAATAYGYGTGVRTYVPSQTTLTVDSLPYVHNGSFVVYNDGYRDGVYIIRISVTEPASIEWIDMSEAAFTLRPGESRIVYFNISITQEQAVPGEHEFVIMPTLLNTNVEPYLDDFASYKAKTDPFTIKLKLAGQMLVTSYQGIPPGAPVVFFRDYNHTNLQQFSILENNHTVTTLLDRAIRLNAPSQVTKGIMTPLTVSIFEGLSERGISMMAVSPNNTLYRVTNGSFIFDQEGLWGIMVLVGDEFILGKTVEVVSPQLPAALLKMPDIGTILAATSLLVLLAVVPIWLITGRRVEEQDPYSDILYKAYVVRKYIHQFDKSRLKRVVQILKNEYNELVLRGAKGKKDEARYSIDELGTLAALE